MKKLFGLLIGAGVLFAVTALYSSPKTDCESRCNKQRQECLAKVSKGKFDRPEDRVKAKEECESRNKSCKFYCK